MPHTAGRTIAAAALLIAVASPSRADDALARRWQAANQPYKRALQASSLNRAPQALAALAQFHAAWAAFRAAYGARPPQPYAKDPQWAPDLVAVSRWAQQAQAELRSGSAHRAHETLEQVRLRWMAMRVRNGVANFGDRLTSFHDPMERVALAVKGRTPDTLSEKQLAVIRDALPALKARWARVAGWKWRSPAPVRDRLVEQLSMAIDELDAACAAEDRAGIVSSGSRLKPTFARLYMQFG